MKSLEIKVQTIGRFTIIGSSIHPSNARHPFKLLPRRITPIANTYQNRNPTTPPSNHSSITSEQFLITMAFFAFVWMLIVRAAVRRRAGERRRAQEQNDERPEIRFPGDIYGTPERRSLYSSTFTPDTLDNIRKALREAAEHQEEE